MEEDDSGAIPIELLEDDTERTTKPNDFGPWLAGYDVGFEQGMTRVFGTLQQALLDVGVEEQVATVIVARVRARARAGGY